MTLPVQFVTYSKRSGNRFSECDDLVRDPSVFQSLMVAWREVTLSDFFLHPQPQASPSAEDMKQTGPVTERMSGWGLPEMAPGSPGGWGSSRPPGTGRGALALASFHLEVELGFPRGGAWASEVGRGSETHRP